jgi:hypothetical protein
LGCLYSQADGEEVRADPGGGEAGLNLGGQRWHQPFTFMHFPVGPPDLSHTEISPPASLVLSSQLEVSGRESSPPKTLGKGTLGLTRLRVGGKVSSGS